MFSITKEFALQLCTDLESEHVERTISTRNTDKFSEAICAFANDFSNSNKNGYLLIGVHDNGDLAGLKANDKFLQSIGGLRSDGNILPHPTISVSSFSFENGDLIVLAVDPSFLPPVRYKGRTYIRVGPRKAIATFEEENILTERRNTNIRSFDLMPCQDVVLDDINIDLFKNKYLPNAIDGLIIKEDKRSIDSQLASLRFYNTKFNCPSMAGVLLFVENPEFFIPGAYIQYVHFEGMDNSANIAAEKKFSGSLISVLNRLDNFIKDVIQIQKPVLVSNLREEKRINYPHWALRELLMNAVMHRDYQSNAPIKFYQYSNRIEIINPGALFGNARPENFPSVNDYRNPIIAESMKVLGYVNKFNRGISKVQNELEKVGNKPAVFNVSKITTFEVIVYSGFDDKSSERDIFNKDIIELWHQVGTKLALSLEPVNIELYDFSPQAGTKLSLSSISLIKALDFCTIFQFIQDIMTAMNYSDRTKFRNKYIKPLMELDILKMSQPDKPTSSKQMYALTETGINLLAFIKQYYKYEI